MDWRNFEIDLEEKKRNGEFYGTLSIKEVNISEANYRRSFTSFESFLGLKTLEDWDSFVEIYNDLQLPLSEDHDGEESVQSCVFKNEHGEQMVKFSWNTFQSPEQVVGDILLSVVHDVVELASIADPNVDDAELFSITENVINRIEVAQKAAGLVVSAMNMISFYNAYLFFQYKFAVKIPLDSGTDADEDIVEKEVEEGQVEDEAEEGQDGTG